jgi:hypothetical protein
LYFPEWDRNGLAWVCIIATFSFIRTWDEQRTINALIKIGTDLMRFPVFAQAIQKCDAILRPHGVDIIDILTNKDESIFDNIMHSFVGIAAVQVN